MKNLGVVIGRFQPFHEAHKNIIQRSIDNNDLTIVFIGSSYRSRSLKNPFTFDERFEMINREFRYDNVIILPLIDFDYDYQVWIHAVEKLVNLYKKENTVVNLYGFTKDDSSYYLNMFEDWNFINCKDINDKWKGFDATQLREKYFSKEFKNGYDLKFLPTSTICFLNRFIKSDEYKEISDLKTNVENYKNLWKNSPYPPIFHSVDAMVLDNTGKILLIERNGEIGCGNLALPGGFLNSTETLMNATLRELKEETNLEISEKFCKFTKTYDKPDRSDIGRMLTTASLFILDKDGSEYSIKASDDARRVFWIPLTELLEDENIFSKLHDDHLSIILNIVINYKGNHDNE